MTDFIIELPTQTAVTVAPVELAPAPIDLPSIFDGVVADDRIWADWLRCFSDWFSSLERDNTRLAYKKAFSQFFDWAGCKPWEVTPRLANQWRTWLGQFGKETKDRHTGEISRQPLSKKSVNAKLAALSSFYTYAQTKYELWPADKQNPFAVVDRHKVKAYNAATYPTTIEAQALLGAINRDVLSGKRDYALIRLFLVTCRRSSELLNLRWRDVSEDNRGDFVFCYIYKGGDDRKDVIKRDCWTDVLDYLRAAGRLDDIQPDDYIFTAIDSDRARRLPHVDNATNGPLTNSMVNKLLKKYARRAGVDHKKAHVHGLRHAGARYRREHGDDIEAIRVKLGHSSLAVTQIYLQETVDTPTDPGGAAAAETFRAGKRGRKAKPQADDVATLKAEIERLKAALGK